MYATCARATKCTCSIMALIHFTAHDCSPTTAPPPAIPAWWGWYPFSLIPKPAKNGAGTNCGARIPTPLATNGRPKRASFTRQTGWGVISRLTFTGWICATNNPNYCWPKQAKPILTHTKPGFGKKQVSSFSPPSAAGGDNCIRLTLRPRR